MLTRAYAGARGYSSKGFVSGTRNKLSAMALSAAGVGKGNRQQERTPRTSMDLLGTVGVVELRRCSFAADLSLFSQFPDEEEVFNPIYIPLLPPPCSLQRRLLILVLVLVLVLRLIMICTLLLLRLPPFIS